MQIVCGTLSVLMIVFAVVQYNDPDFAMWGAIYGATALWAGLAAFAPRVFGAVVIKLLLLVSLVLAVWGCIHFFPDAERWWDIEVWWPETGEPAREGMGMMIVLISLLAASAVGLRRT